MTHTLHICELPNPHLEPPSTQVMKAYPWPHRHSWDLPRLAMTLTYP